MSKESKRMFLLAALAFAWIWGAQFLMDRLGFLPKPVPKPAAQKVVAGNEPAPLAAMEPAAAGQPVPAMVAAPAESKIKIVPPSDLVMGSLVDGDGYKLKVQLAQNGAGVEMLDLKDHEADRVLKKESRLPLRLIQPDSESLSSFATQLVDVRDPNDRGETSPANLFLLNPLWDVVPDQDGRTVRPVLADRAKQNDAAREIGQEIVFQGTIQTTPPVTITKAYRLLKGADGLELTLNFSSPEADRKITYSFNGPHGLPIEGEWYTSLYREALIGFVEGTTTKIETRLASDIAKRAEPERFVTLPMKFAGVENQYFAVFFAPDPAPTPETRIDAESMPLLVRPDPKDLQRSDITVAMTSRPIQVGPNRSVTHRFRIFAGPKTTDALLPYGAEGLAAYRKSGSFAIPGASWLAQRVISPLLQRIYGVTTTIAKSLGGKTGNYGIAIILLTITVRLILFPLSRKQAISAKKMQDLQPLMTELKEKYKDDKEAQTRETFALYKRNGVNPLGGCLLGLIQLPIFVGLWQALNNSVALRHAPFLWIDNLAAPDMLMKFPTEIPFLGNYFNILPLAVVGLMLVQTKLFSPPATTPDQEMTQKMMKYMMVFMGFMFYKVPSGLGLYFITSSSWAICERLLLPKMLKSKPVSLADPLADSTTDARPTRPKIGSSSNSGQGGNPGTGPSPSTGLGGFRDRLKERFEQLKDEAAKDRTVRNDDKDRDRDWGKGTSNRPRPKPGGKR